MPAAVARDLDVRVVVVRLDVEPGPKAELRVRRGAEIDHLGQRAVHAVALVGPPERTTRVRVGGNEAVARRAVELDLHASPRKLDVADRVLVHRGPECAAGRHGVAEHDVRGLTRRCGLGIAVLLVRSRAEERVGCNEVRVELLDAGLTALLEDRIDVRRRIDSLDHQRADEVLAAGLLTEELEEHVRQAVVGRGRLEVGPIVELRIG